MALRNNNPYSSPHSTSGDAAWNDQSMLIRACIAENREAQRALYEKYAPTAYALIKRYTRHDELAQEMLNDSFFKVLTRLKQYNGEGAFEGWIRRIVINTITDHLRKHIKKKEREVNTEHPVEQFVDNNIVGNLSYKELLAMIHELPDMQRAVFNLHVFEDQKHKEIGALLDISEGNSRWYLNDARKRLKEKINSLVNR